MEEDIGWTEIIAGLFLIVCLAALAWFSSITWPIGIVWLSLGALCLLIDRKTNRILAAVAGDMSLGLWIGVSVAFLIWIYLSVFDHNAALRNGMAHLEAGILWLYFKLKLVRTWLEFPLIIVTGAVLCLVQYWTRSEQTVERFFKWPLIKWLSTAGIAMFALSSFTFFSDRPIWEFNGRDHQARMFRIRQAEDKNRIQSAEALSGMALAGDGTSEDSAYLAELFTQAKVNGQPAATESVLEKIANEAFTSGEGGAHAVEIAAAIERYIGGPDPGTPGATPSVDENAPPPSDGRPQSTLELDTYRQREIDAEEAVQRATAIREQALIVFQKSIVSGLSKVPGAALPGGDVYAELARKYASKVISKFSERYLVPRLTSRSLSELLQATNVAVTEGPFKFSRSFYPKPLFADLRRSARLVVEPPIIPGTVPDVIVEPPPPAGTCHCRYTDGSTLQLPNPDGGNCKLVCPPTN